MPVAPIIGAGIGAAGSAASGASGKKAQGQANALAKEQLGLEKQQYGLGNAVLAPASSFWQNLLRGGQAAVQATGPYASLLGQGAQGTANSIRAMTPRGGEQNLALAQNQMQLGNNVARLYAGMQPLAAQNLAQIGGTYLGSGSSLGFPATMGGLGAAQMGMQNAQQAGQGFGSLLYNSLNKPNMQNWLNSLGQGTHYVNAGTGPIPLFGH